MKRRSYRRTKEEEQQHEIAVKLRKMTDQQLCQYIEDERQQAAAAAQKELPSESDVLSFMEQIKKDKIPGIGGTTIDKLSRAARNYGYVD